MVTQTVSHELAEIALDRASGAGFENFFQAFYPALTGTSFIPLGGTGDGGADAFSSTSVYSSGKPNVYYQASTQSIKLSVTDSKSELL